MTSSTCGLIPQACATLKMIVEARFQRRHDNDRASTDADAAAELEIQLTGTKTLTVGDFRS